MNKKYILFCHSFGIGGGQAYVNKKIEYLNENGWETFVFACTKGCDEILWPNLKQFKDNISPYLRFAPEFWSRRIVDDVISWIVTILNVDKNADIIIESCTDYFAEWGELLAQELNGKNFCFLLDEIFNKYRAKDFLFFKYNRREIATIHDKSIDLLFENTGFCVENHYNSKLLANNGEQVQDIPFTINKPDADWCIAYIGRDKQYTAAIVSDLLVFADSHKEKNIAFFIVGEINSINHSDIPRNLLIVNVGFLSPLPAGLFKYFDVVIAGSGCASLSTRQGVPTIVADAKTCRAIGVLGYTVGSTLFSDEIGERFNVALEDVLIRKQYLTHEFSYPMNISDYKESFQEHFAFLDQSDTKRVYYDFDKNKPKIHIKDRILFLKYYIYLKFPSFYQVCSKCIRKISIVTSGISKKTK